MKLYETKENTPLSFFKFYRNIYVPFGFAACVYSISRNMILSNFMWYSNWYTLTLTLTGLFLAAVDVVIFIGLIKWKRYVLTLIVIEFAVTLINYTCSIMNTVHQPYLLAFTIATFVISITINILVIVYFYKRRLLFDGVPYHIEPPAYTPGGSYYYTVRRCASCGKDCPSPEYKYCPECGMEYTDR